MNNIKLVLNIIPPRNIPMIKIWDEHGTNITDEKLIFSTTSLKRYLRRELCGNKPKSKIFIIKPIQRDRLKLFSVKSLRQIAKENNINLKSKTRKDDIVDILFEQLDK